MPKNQSVLKPAGDEQDEDSAMLGKHARGRPRLASAMSDAQRAKRYRDNKKLLGESIKRDDHGVTPIKRDDAGVPQIKRDDAGVTFNRPTVIEHGAPHNATATSPSYGMLESRIILLNSATMRLSDQLDEARDQIAALKKALRDAEDVTRHEKSSAGSKRKRR
jgi:hypothetical protein